jgi:hypothetical protein
VHEWPLAEPAAPLDDFAVQDCDLAGRPAEGNEAEFQPEQECFAARRNGF